MKRVQSNFNSTPLFIGLLTVVSVKRGKKVDGGVQRKSMVLILKGSIGTLVLNTNAGSNKTINLLKKARRLPSNPLAVRRVEIFL